MISVYAGQAENAAVRPDKRSVTIDGDYVIAGTGVEPATGQRPLIIAYKLGAKGQLPGAGP